MRSHRLVVAVAVLCVLTSGCRSPGPGRAAGTGLDELAHALAGPGDNAARWEAELRAANGGASTVDDAVARQLQARTAVVDAIWSATNDVSSLACDAWTNGGDRIVLDGLPSLATAAQAQDLLDRMHEDTERGSVAVESVTLACGVVGVANSGL